MRGFDIVPPGLSSKALTRILAGSIVIGVVGGLAPMPVKGALMLAVLVAGVVRIVRRDRKVNAYLSKRLADGDPVSVAELRGGRRPRRFRPPAARYTVRRDTRLPSDAVGWLVDGGEPR